MQIYVDSELLIPGPLHVRQGRVSSCWAGGNSFPSHNRPNYRELGIVGVDLEIGDYSHLGASLNTTVSLSV